MMAASSVNALAQTGFDHRLSKLHGLYGAGSYFADASSKSHQYTDGSAFHGGGAATAGGAGNNDKRVMLLCRVTMGAAFLTRASHKNERRPPTNPESKCGSPYDSIFAQSGVANCQKQIHNEYLTPIRGVSHCVEGF